MVFNPKHLKYYHFKLSIKVDQLLVNPNLWSPLFFTHLSLNVPRVSAHTVFKEHSSFLHIWLPVSICSLPVSLFSQRDPLTSLLVPSNCLGPHLSSLLSVSQNFTAFDARHSRHRCSLLNCFMGAAGQKLNTGQSLGNDGCLQSSQTTELYLKNIMGKPAKKTTQKPPEEGEAMLACPPSSLLFWLSAPHKVTRFWVALFLLLPCSELHCLRK